jgi:hypothetical protein
MTTDKSTTEISEQCPSNVEKMNSSKDQMALREIFRRVGIHSDGGRSQECTDDDNHLSDKFWGC